MQWGVGLSSVDCRVGGISELNQGHQSANPYSPKLQYSYEYEYGVRYHRTIQP